ncbi:hypothetical protein Tco_0105104, partial [Tanacetum coccineum]
MRFTGACQSSGPIDLQSEQAEGHLHEKGRKNQLELAFGSKGSNNLSRELHTLLSVTEP